MTEIQTQVFSEINDLLREHFEGSLLVVLDETNEGRMANLAYNGGLLQAIGIARAAEHKLTQHQSDGIAFRSEEEEED